VGRVNFRSLREVDLPLLAEWRARPHVAAWFGPPDSIDDLRKEFLIDSDTPPSVRGYIALLDHHPIGFIQSYIPCGAGDGWWPDERDRGARGIDQFLGEELLLGRGLGTAVVRAFLARLFGDPEVSKVQTDPSPENRCAIRCYEKAGFKRVGVVETPDGQALLMVCRRARFQSMGAQIDIGA
jgi:aminoglycoside 6'-N-acetyltransferase Ib